MNKELKAKIIKQGKDFRVVKYKSGWLSLETKRFNGLGEEIWYSWFHIDNCQNGIKSDDLHAIFTDLFGLKHE